MLICLLLTNYSFSQTDSNAINNITNAAKLKKRNSSDTTKTEKIVVSDSLNKNNIVSDSTVIDTLHIQISPSAVKDIVNYIAVDSIRFDIKNKKAYLFNNAKIDYEDITLSANYVEISTDKNQIFASGLKDTSGNITGKPIFKQGLQTFKTEKITYNFNTKKGLINTVITQEGDGFMHGEKIKKFSNNTTFVRHGKYTTCDLEHPHFELSFAKAKVIPNDVIVTGPAFLKIEGIPTPIGIPFGFFPNKKGRKSGLIIPGYGEAENRGFYFENGGFYWGISDNFDVSFIGDIYTRGSYAAKLRSDYKVRYKYSGNLYIAHATNILGEKNTESYEKYKDFMFRWSHIQDPKAHPVRRFSANVNIMTSKFNKFNPTSANDYLSNTFQSAISYSTSWKGKYFLSTNMTHSQNIITRQMSMSLPEISFSVNSFYPFRSHKSTSNFKWYENINISYSNNLKNNITSADSTLFEGDIFKKMQNGMKHSIPISSSIKVLKYFNWTNRIDYNEYWYLNAIERNWDNSSLNDSVTGFIRYDTISGFNTARYYSFSSSLSTKFFGMIQFKKGYIKAFRHVVSPSINFTYHPDFSTSRYGYYKYYYDIYDNQAVLTKYSIFGSNIYGGPPMGKAGQMNFSIANNLEMKIKGSSDTVDAKKIVLIENLSISTAIDFTRDSMQWVPLSISGRTTLFRNLYVTYNSIWDPYSKNSDGKPQAKTEYELNKRLFRLTQSDWNFSLNWALSPSLFSKKNSNNQKSNTNYTIPWSINLNYNLFYTNREDIIPEKYTNNTVQTLGFTGEINLTGKWKISGSSGYDFINKELSYTSIDIYRDLHCWEMRFNWIPIGYRKSWNFTINVKSSILQDLKYVKKKDFRDEL